MKDERPDADNIYDIDAFFSSSYFFAAQSVKKSDVVLDSGCGSGYGTDYLAGLTDGDVFGNDYEEKVISANQKKYDKKNLHFVNENNNKLSFSDNFFNVITSFEVIEHVDDYNYYLLELKRVLKNDGILIIATPNKDYYSPGLKKPVIISHKKEFYPHEFAELFQDKFSAYELYGKFFTESGLEKYQRLQENIRGKVKLTRVLARFQIVRILAKYIPQSIRVRLSGSTPSKYYLEADFIIRKTTVEECAKFSPLGLVAVIKK